MSAIDPENALDVIWIILTYSYISVTHMTWRKITNLIQWIDGLTQHSFDAVINCKRELYTYMYICTRNSSSLKGSWYIVTYVLLIGGFIIS